MLWGQEKPSCTRTSAVMSSCPWQTTRLLYSLLVMRHTRVALKQKDPQVVLSHLGWCCSFWTPAVSLSFDYGHPTPPWSAVVGAMPSSAWSAVWQLTLYFSMSKSNHIQLRELLVLHKILPFSSLWVSYFKRLQGICKLYLYSKLYIMTNNLI